MALIEQFKLKDPTIRNAFFVVLPIFFFLILMPFDRPESILTLAVIAYAVFGMPTVAIIGMIATALFRHTARPSLWSSVGFAIPSIIVCLYLLWNVLADNHMTH